MRHLKRTLKHNQFKLNRQGSALLAVFLLMATVTVLVADMTERQFLDIRRTGHLLAQDQAALYAQAAEALAIRVLIDDYQDEKKGKGNRKPGVITDFLQDDWHQKVTFPLEGGAISAQLTDLQSVLNLNDLNNDRWEARLRFRRLLTNLGLALQYNPDELMRDLLEWIDGDDQTQNGGVEDLHYLGLDPAYRTANQFLVSVDELRMVKGFERDLVVKLLPYVAALPEGLPLNINTADVEVLTTYSNIGDIGKLIEGRAEKEGFETVAEAIQTAGANASAIDQTAFTVQSQYFLLEASAVINGRTATIRSILYRPLVLDDNSSIKVIARNRATQFG